MAPSWSQFEFLHDDCIEFDQLCFVMKWDITDAYLWYLRKVIKEDLTVCVCGSMCFHNLFCIFHRICCSTNLVWYFDFKNLLHELFWDLLRVHFQKDWKNLDAFNRAVQFSDGLASLPLPLSIVTDWLTDRNWKSAISHV